MTLEELKNELQIAVNERDKRKYSGTEPDQVKIIKGRSYHRIDIGNGGAYMYEIATGFIYGIKGYGRVNKRKLYGHLDDISALEMFKKLLGTWY